MNEFCGLIFTHYLQILVALADELWKCFTISMFSRSI